MRYFKCISNGQNHIVRTDDNLGHWRFHEPATFPMDCNWKRMDEHDLETISNTSKFKE